jgi:tight adherence protein C
MRSQQRGGSSIVADLRTLAESSRKQRMEEVERKVAKVPTTMTVVAVLFLLPSIMVVVGGPAFMNVKKTLSAMGNHPPAKSAPQTAGGAK